MYHYVVVREDLPLGVQAAQLVHAAGESVTGPVPSGTHAVVLSVPNEHELWALREQLVAAGLEVTAVIENDAPYTNQIMAIGIRPGPRARIRPHVSSLQLLRERKETRIDK